MSEGARTTRSGRTPYGGRRSANPALTSQVLIGLNVLAWLLVLATGGRFSPWIDRLALLPTGRCQTADGRRFLPGFGEADCAAQPAFTWVPGVADGAVWQLVTSMFTHVDVWHIGFNMLALYILGPQLELAVGRARFLALYLLSGLTGSALVYLSAPAESATLGASGAIYGLMAGLLVIAVKVRADVSQLLLWIGLNFVITLVGRSFISWQGHLGGFLGGALIAAVLVYAPRRRRQTWQTVGLAAIAAVLLAALVARTAVLAPAL